MNGEIDNTWKKRNDQTATKLSVAANRLFGNMGPDTDLSAIWGTTSYDSSAGPSGEGLMEVPQQNGQPGTLPDAAERVLDNPQQLAPGEGIPDGQTGMLQKLKKQLDLSINSKAL
jgi:hypothetical protein